MYRTSQFLAFKTFLKRIIWGYTTPNCVGVDISSSAIKMLELSPHSLQIAKYSIWPLAKYLVAEGVVHDIEKVSEIIYRQWAKLSPLADHAALALPHNAVIIKDLTVPLFSSKYVLDQYLHEQLVLDLEHEDIDFDYTIKQNNSEINKQYLWVVVAKKEKIEEYQAIAQMAMMQVAVIDIEPFALINLYTRLFKMQQLAQHILILNLAATRIQAFIYADYQNLLFTEISVNYSSIIEELILTAYGKLNLSEMSNLDALAMDLLMHNSGLTSNLVAQISLDVAKIIKLINLNLVVEKKTSLTKQTLIYLDGGNSLIPGVYAALDQVYPKRIYLINDLLSGFNQQISKADLARLTTAIALASWSEQDD